MNTGLKMTTAAIGLAATTLTFSNSLSAASDKCPAHSTMHCYYIPESVSSMSGRTSHGAGPIGKTYVGIYNVKPDNIAINSLGSWNLGDFTGYYTGSNNSQRSNYQRSFSVDTGYGRTAAQMKGTQTGLHLHTWSTPGEHEKDVPTLQLKYSFPAGSVKPWGNADAGNKELCFSFWLGIPDGSPGRAPYPESIYKSQHLNGNAVAFYGQSILIMGHRGLNKAFHFVQDFYDNRIDRVPAVEFVSEDSRVGAFAGAVYQIGNGSTTQYTRAIPTSSGFQNLPWDGKKFFGSCISKTHLQNIISDMNAADPKQNLPLDIDNYELLDLSVSLEASHRNRNVNGHISAVIDDMWVYKTK